ncbi:MAG: Cytosolic Fe-S cluster assembly factor nar1 [Piccolia ochrophora]|nr:MAG: Cytosolic Fe-S cluster assembly factor nar1 [Piccolia ochrophora]
MSAILSADDLNDFISPGVACIKPVETLPPPKAQDPQNPYEVTTEDKVAAENLPPAEISLTDCLACSGCVTSAEAVLVSLQSHTEVLNALDSAPSMSLDRRRLDNEDDVDMGGTGEAEEKLFVASVSPQTRASLAVAFGVTETEAGYMLDQLLTGPDGLRTGGKYGNGFTWTFDTNVAREACLHLGAEEVAQSSLSKDDIFINSTASTSPKRPILTTACPGWVCYAEKTHPHVLPHLSRLKSPQALLGTLLKTSLSKKLNISPSRIWHVAIMPCFDKKLEASRAELTDIAWNDGQPEGIRDVDCVITTREIILIAAARNISLHSIPLSPLPASLRPPFPDAQLASFLFPSASPNNSSPATGTSGGYLSTVLSTTLTQHPGSTLETTRGRNADVIDYAVIDPSSPTSPPILRAARYYGFRNIQNLVRKLKPPRTSRLPGSRKPAARAEKSGIMDYAYIEVMACPGGCTNGGAQLRPEEVVSIQQSAPKPADSSLAATPRDQRSLLARVDEAYFSSSPSPSPSPPSSPSLKAHTALTSPHSSSMPRAEYITSNLAHWSSLVGVPLDKLVRTSYTAVESDVGKKAQGETERVVELAGKIGGGW